MSRYVIRDLDNFSLGACVPIIWAEDEHIYYEGNTALFEKQQAHEKEYISYIKPTEGLVIIAISDADPDFYHSSLREYNGRDEGIYLWDGDGDGTDGFNTCVLVDDPSEGIHARQGIMQSADLDDDPRQYNYVHKKENMNDC